MRSIEWLIQNVKWLSRWLSVIFLEILAQLVILLLLVPGTLYAYDSLRWDFLLRHAVLVLRAAYKYSVLQYVVTVWWSCHTSHIKLLYYSSSTWQWEMSLLVPSSDTPYSEPYSTLYPVRRFCMVRLTHATRVPCTFNCCTTVGLRDSVRWVLLWLGTCTLQRAVLRVLLRTGVLRVLLSASLLYGARCTMLLHDWNCTQLTVVILRVPEMTENCKFKKIQFFQ